MEGTTISNLQHDWGYASLESYLESRGELTEEEETSIRLQAAFSPDIRQNVLWNWLSVKDVVNFDSAFFLDVGAYKVLFHGMRSKAFNQYVYPNLEGVWWTMKKGIILSQFTIDLCREKYDIPNNMPTFNWLCANQMVDIIDLILQSGKVIDSTKKKDSYGFNFNKCADYSDFCEVGASEPCSVQLIAPLSEYSALQFESSKEMLETECEVERLSDISVLTVSEESDFTGVSVSGVYAPALIWACIQKHTSLALKLIKHPSVDLKHSFSFNDGKNQHNDCTILHALVNSEDFFLMEQVSFSSSFLESTQEEKSSFLNARCALGCTALQCACAIKSANMVKLLLSMGACCRNQDMCGSTALHKACWVGSFEIVCTLIKVGVELIDLEKRDADGNTPLHIAAQGGTADIVKHLLQTNLIDIDARNDNGNTSLMEVCSMGHEDVVKLLLNNGSKVDCRNEEGCTALMIACREGCADIAKLLIVEGRADVDLSDDAGQTPLHYCVRWGYTTIAKVIIQEGIPDVNIRDERGLTILHWACLQGFTEIATLLVEECNADIYVKDGDGCTPYDLATRDTIIHPKLKN